jgi:hypothetical protein
LRAFQQPCESGRMWDSLWEIACGADPSDAQSMNPEQLARKLHWSLAFIILRYTQELERRGRTDLAVKVTRKAAWNSRTWLSTSASK